MRLPFIKMHVCGNHFIFVDELGREPMPDILAADLARKLTDPYRGIGGNGLIRLGGSHPSDSAGVSFRLLEPDGSESLSCGNGLLCAGRYLADRYGVKTALFQTQLPTGKPVGVVSGETGGRRWIRVPIPERIPDFLFCPDRYPEFTNPLGPLSFHLESRRKNFLMEGDEPECRFTAYPIFTGEPHLVVRAGDIQPKDWARSLFPELNVRMEMRKDTGNFLLNRMGGQVLSQYPELFPQGTNLMVGRASETGEVVYVRSFERGILRETLACGTGALACAAVMGKGDAIRVVPEMASRYMGSVGYTVIPGKREWYLYGDPEILWEGVWTGFQPEEGGTFAQAMV